MKKTVERVAEKYKVSPSTIIRDSHFAAGIDRLSNKERAQYFSGEIPLKKKDIEYYGQNKEIDLEDLINQAKPESNTMLAAPSSQKKSNAGVKPDAPASRNITATKLTKLLIKFQEGIQELYNDADKTPETIDSLAGVPELISELKNTKKMLEQKQEELKGKQD
jgi:hypothetical protein